MIDEESIVNVTAEQVACDMKGELLILQTASGIYYGLDPVGRRVWSLMEEPRRVGAIRDVILDEYQVDREKCTRDLLDLLEKLASKRLVEVKSAPAS
ncbi:MAG: PqqD family peptide modification chaperone [Acidobacteriia bacterium]|nr:PqqD family peptide modification chaperone [Terriglobia bacterium]